MVAGLPSQPSAQLQPVLDWLVGCEEISVERLSGALSDVSYEHVILPASLNLPPSTSKEAWLNWFRGGFAKLFDRGMVTFSSKGTTKRGEAFTNEYLGVFQVRQDTPGGKFVIWRVKEFVDSATIVRFRSQLPVDH